MKQHTRRLVIMLGGALISCGGLVLVACSTDNGTTPLPGAGTDSGKDTGSTTGKDGDTTGTDGDITNPDGGGNADCGQAPVLHANDKGGFYCAFLKARDAGIDAGGPFNCTNNETCCNPAKVGTTFPDSYCAPSPVANKGDAPATAACSAGATAAGSTWTDNKGSTWECADKDNCDTGQVCCLFTDPGAAAGENVNVGKYLDNTKVPASCNASQLFKYGGSHCADACKTDKTEIQTCSKTEACAGGKTCTPFEVVPGGKELAYCK